MTFGKAPQDDDLEVAPLAIGVPVSKPAAVISILDLPLHPCSALTPLNHAGLCGGHPPPCHRLLLVILYLAPSILCSFLCTMDVINTCLLDPKNERRTNIPCLFPMPLLLEPLKSQCKKLSCMCSQCCHCHMFSTAEGRMV